MKKGIPKQSIICTAIIVIGVILDQISKYFTVKYIELYEDIPFIKDFVHFTYRRNTGAAFSFMSGYTWFFILMTSLIVIVICFLLYAGMVKNNIAFGALAFIVSGGIGNLIDRIFRGFVVDMLDFKFFKIPAIEFSPFSLSWNDFAVFNVADSFVTCGTVVFLLVFIFTKGEVISWNLPFPKNKKNNASTSSSQNVQN